MPTIYILTIRKIIVHSDTYLYAVVFFACNNNIKYFIIMLS